MGWGIRMSEKQAAIALCAIVYKAAMEKLGIHWQLSELSFR